MHSSFVTLTGYHGPVIFAMFSMILAMAFGGRRMDDQSAIY
jgi:hypothetical protein